MPERQRPATGLALLRGSLSVHLDSEPHRLPAHRRAIASGALPPGYAVEDCAAVLFAGTDLAACVSSRRGARVLRITADGAGGTIERELAVTALPGAAEAGPAATTGHQGADRSGADSFGVSELRGLRAGRHRWD